MESPITSPFLSRSVEPPRSYVNKFKKSAGSTRRSSLGSILTSLETPRSPRQQKQRRQSFDVVDRCLSSPHSSPWNSPKPSPNSPRKTQKVGDRFIPSRSSTDVEISHFNLFKENVSSPSLDTTPLKEEYKSSLADQMFSGKLNIRSPARILNFQDAIPRSPYSGNPCPLRLLHQKNLALNTDAKTRYHRQIPHNPEKVLDAPDLVDDYYLNLLDWSTNNIVVIALGKSVYLWNASNGESQLLMSNDDPQNVVTSVSFIKNGEPYLAIGNNDAEVQVWDIEASRKICSFRGHASRVSSLDWNEQILTSGSRDSLIINNDVRLRGGRFQTLAHHTQEVCGLRWSQDGTLLASGGNDNLLNIWEFNQPNQPRFTLDHHDAAVKALAWCPMQTNLLASGGGTADRTIRFWNTTTGACINVVDTKSQVCAIQWSHHYKELVSSHGYSQNQLIVWKYPSMQKVAELKGHSSRVLHMAQSPDGKTVASAAGDETLRFWKIFDTQQKKNKHTHTRGSILTGPTLR